MRRLLVVVVASVVMVSTTWSGAVPAAVAGTGSGTGSGPWVWPVDGPRQVSRAFAPPASTYGTGHRGADLASVPGAAVRAAGAGRVAYAGLLAGRGVVVVVHGSLRTTYEPVEALVGVDDRVAAGQVVGTLGAGHVGCPSRACLHWGLRRGETYLDPVRLVRAGPVRLLPVSGANTTARRNAAPTGASAPAAAQTGRPAAPAAGGRVRQTAASRALQLDAVSGSAERSPALGLLALALLGAGVAVLARPRRPPPSPPSPPPSPAAGGPAGALSPEPAPVEHRDLLDRPYGTDPLHLPVADLHDLQAERTRRRGA